MLVNWATTSADIVPDTYVYWGKSENNLVNSAEGTVRKFTDSGSEKRVIYIHLANMTGLEASTRYYYKVGAKADGFS